MLALPGLMEILLFLPFASGHPCWVVCGPLATRGTPFKTTECPRGRVFISLAKATILVTTQARHSQGTVNLDLGCQALGADVEKSSHTFFYRHRPKHFSTQPKHYWKCRWGQH